MKTFAILILLVTSSAHALECKLFEGGKNTAYCRSESNAAGKCVLIQDISKDPNTGEVLWQKILYAVSGQKGYDVVSTNGAHGPVRSVSLTYNPHGPGYRVYDDSYSDSMIEWLKDFSIGCTSGTYQD